MTPTSPEPATIRWRRRPLVLRAGDWSIRSTVHASVVLAGMLALCVALAVLTLGVGEYHVSPSELVAVLTGENRGFDRVVVLEWRLPRIVLALMVGAALGLSGAIFQALTRNPLGSPDIIGFNTGAYTGALVMIGLAGSNDYYRTAAGALVGGLVVAALVYTVSSKRGIVQAYRLIIVGIAIGAVMDALNQWIIIRIDLRSAVSAAFWEQGSLNGLEWAQALPVGVLLLVLAVVLLRVAPSMAIVQMGDDVAGSLGVRVGRSRALLFVIGVALVAVAAAAAGPIAFVALAAPQIARRLTGSSGVALLPAAATGATLLLASDLIALRLIAPTQLPLGTVTVCIGGSYLVYLLVSQARGGRL